MRSGWVALLTGGMFFVVAAGCGSTASPKNSEIGGGAFQSGEVKCASDADCNTGEACGNGVCQMKRCGDPNYTSTSPLGTMGYFARDLELVVVGDDTQVQGYSAQDRAFVKPANAAWSSVNGKIVDMTGGNFFGSRPEAVAWVTQASQNILVQGGGNKKTTLTLPYSPIALSGGDVNADELQEVVAFSDKGKVSVCDAVSSKCETTDIIPPQVPGGPPPTAPDVIDGAVGDVDGDGYAEPVLLTKKSLIIANLDAAKTGQAKVIELAVDKVFTRIAMGDLDGDGSDEIVGIYDGTFGDDLYVFSVKAGQLVPKGSTGTSNGSADLAVGHYSGRDKPEVALLRTDGTIEMFTMGSAGKLVSEYTGLLASKATSRIAIADVTGDSPARRIVSSKPRLVAGTVVPVAVLSLPPYSRTYSDGRSSVSMGREDSKSTTKREGMTFSAQVGLGFEAEFSLPIVKVVSVEAEAHYRQERWKYTGATTTVSTSATFEIEAKPEMEGFDSGAVVLGCGCYHQYDYKLEDPARKLGATADGKIFSVFVPVAAQTSVWSTKRYAALVDALGTKALPRVKLPYQIGQVASYPTRGQTLEGQVIPEDDIVFKEPPTLRVSDVAETSFELTIEKEKTEEEWVWKGGGASASIGIFGVSVQGSIDAMWGRGYELGVTQASSFAGTVPPLRNNPNTPEDELKLYGYSFTPIVYRQRYKTPTGEDSGFFVLTYAVGK